MSMTNRSPSNRVGCRRIRSKYASISALPRLHVVLVEILDAAPEKRYQNHYDNQQQVALRRGRSVIEEAASGTEDIEAIELGCPARSTQRHRNHDIDNLERVNGAQKQNEPEDRSHQR